MPASWEDAVKEAYTSSPKGVVIYETLQVSHPSVAEDYYLINQRESFDLPLEDGGGPVTFKASGFNFTLPPTGENGTQDLRLSIDNVDREITDFLMQVIGSAEPVKITYRPYLSSDLTKPQLDPPLELTLRDVKINNFNVTGRATFADVLNQPFPNDYYTRTRFPSLGN